MATPRRTARIVVMQTLFAREEYDGNTPEVLDYMLEQYPDQDHMTEVRPFAVKTFTGVIEHRAEIRERIQEFATEWPVEKLAPIDRAILEIGAYEILFSDEVPPIVAINEAIEIAKEYGDTNAPKFVNGVLSKIMEQYAQHRDFKTGALNSIPPSP